MKKTLLFLCSLMMATLAMATNVEQAQALATRLSPRLAAHVTFVQAPADSADYFILEQDGSHVKISGNNANAMATGLGHYLKDYCKTTVSWFADVPVELPDVLPSVNERITVKARVPQRFFLNYCTYGYTMVFWQWHDWERFIDWMALNGINLPLAITGQESIWYKVWKKLGMKDEEIRAYFTGPAYLPWHRMANIDAWCGPLPKHWLDTQEQLQKQIVARERALNMRPVLPAFAGHVPLRITKLYPKCDVKPLEVWDEFEKPYNTYFLDSEDPLYTRIQKLFIQEQTKAFGTDHIYGIDPFNEMSPPNWEPEYLGRVSKHIYQSLAAADPKAEWLQMAWFLYYQRKDWTPERTRAMMQGVPEGKMTMLDYFCERMEVWRMHNGFYGQPFVWCYLGNFGGSSAMQGNVLEAGAKLEKAYQEAGKDLIGVGSTLEGLDVQQFPYEYILDKAWNYGVSDSIYVAQLAERHVGKASLPARLAWWSLAQNVFVHYAYTRGPQFNFSPRMQEKAKWTRDDYYYRPDLMVNAWLTLLQQPSVDRDAMTLDIIAAGREALGLAFNKAKLQFDQAYTDRDLKGLQQNGQLLLDIITDADILTAHHPFCTVQKWIGMARDYGNTPALKDYYEMNARRLITTWGGDLDDYANRSWAGLIGEYYHHRWQMYVDEVIAAVKQGKEFNQDEFDKKVFAYELDWAEQHTSIALPHTTDVLTFSRHLADKYAHLLP
ncbi:MAG: alpha-N-acetylglucosaminidase [Muribaculaceae bacterium]|nr:alpha-N-acetylglucosaminidase [Muribaculaceae bacterium]